MNDLKNMINVQIKKMDIKLDEKKIDLICQYWQILRDWNQKINLTRIIEKRDFAIKHLADSLFILKYIEIPEGSEFIDIGTGPGIPGLLIKIVRPDIKMSLLESQRKKTDFLNFTIEKLELENIKVINDRAEIVAHDMAYREKFDFVAARAVSALNVLAELCLPFVKMGGFFVAMKGPNIADEMRDAESALNVMGGEIIKIFEYQLDDGSFRNLIKISKKKESPPKYPRKPGIPEKNPL